MVADFCEFSLDTRFLPGMDPNDVIRQIKKIVGSVAPKFKFIIEDLQHPYEINERHPFVRAYVDAAKELKIKAHVKGSEGATVITFFQNKKIPAFATGFGSHGTAHTTDEYVKIKHLDQGCRVLERFLRNYDEQ
jgi:succinyl-diaminopimelate desuccinylase